MRSPIFFCELCSLLHPLLIYARRCARCGHAVITLSCAEWCCRAVSSRARRSALEIGRLWIQDETCTPGRPQGRPQKLKRERRELACVDTLASKEESPLQQKNAIKTSTATPSSERKHRTTYSHKRSASRGLEQVLEREVLGRERPRHPEARVDEASPRFGQRVGISRHIQQFQWRHGRGRRSAEPRHHITECG